VNLNRIYLDNAATTPLRSEVAREMRQASGDANFNPSSLHAEGRRTAALLDAARERVATSLHAARNEIIFTSSGTEADNLAILGVLRTAGAGAHFVSTAFEHRAVLSTLDRLRAEGFEVTVLPIDRDGFVDVQAFARALRPQTALASVMYANNEIGTVQPIAELASIARERGVLFHTDAIASTAWLDLDVRELAVDLLSLSGHKCGGPKGVGALYARRGVPMVPILYGGSQEFGRRSGTQNVAGAVGMAAAMALAARERQAARERVSALRDRLWSGIQAAIEDVGVNGAGPRLPNVLNVSFAGVDSSSLLIALDLAGVAASAGSACASGSPEPSHVLAAIGLDRAWQQGAIRFSLGVSTTAGEIERVLEVLPPIVSDLRRPAAVAASRARGDG
jgi:cysteine desulfurase